MSGKKDVWMDGWIDRWMEHFEKKGYKKDKCVKKGMMY